MKRFFIYDAGSRGSVDIGGVVVGGRVHILDTYDIKIMSANQRNNFKRLLSASDSMDKIATVTDKNGQAFDIVKSVYDFAETDIEYLIEHTNDLVSVIDFFANLIITMMRDGKFDSLADAVIDLLC